MPQRTKDRRAIPHYGQLLQAIGAKPRTAELQMAPGWAAYSRLSEKKQKSMGAVAILLGTTRLNIRKALLLGPNPDDAAVQAAGWRHGRPVKRFGLAPAEFSWLEAPATLRRQTGMSLVERTDAFNNMWRPGKPKKELLSWWNLRAIYRGMHISLQRIGPRLGRPVLEPP